MKKAVIQLEELACPACVQKIESAIKALDGVDSESVKVLFNASKAKFSFDEEKIGLEDVKDAITIMGYEVIG
ncbi:cation transporter [Clostridiaceae bacterium OttesenSCG-928-D20]|nr:cation transporter [Clostridiaceae bacterium OttesenSCG-928-D20]